jgi:hypothetical protein
MASPYPDEDVERYYDMGEELSCLRQDNERLKTLLKDLWINLQTRIWKPHFNCDNPNFGIQPPCGECISCRVNAELSEKK